MLSFTAKYSLQVIIFFPLYLNRMNCLTLDSQGHASGDQCDKISVNRFLCHGSPMIPSPVIHFYPMKIIFVLRSHLNHYEHNREGLWLMKDCERAYLFLFLVFPLEEEHTMILHSLPRLLFTRLFLTHLVKLRLLVFHKAYPDPSKPFCYLYCKLAKIPIFIPIRTYNLLKWQLLDDPISKILKWQDWIIYYYNTSIQNSVYHIQTLNCQIMIKLMDIFGNQLLLDLKVVSIKSMYLQNICYLQLHITQLITCLLFIIFTFLSLCH